MGNLSIFSIFSMFFDFIYYMLIFNKIFEGVSATPVRSNKKKAHFPGMFGLPEGRDGSIQYSTTWHYFCPICAYSLIYMYESF